MNKIRTTPLYRKETKVSPRKNLVQSMDIFDQIQRSQWYEEDHMNASNIHLKKFNSSVGALYNLEFGVSDKYPPAGSDRWIQPLHNEQPKGAGH